VARIVVLGREPADLQAVFAILEMAEGHDVLSFDSASSSLDDILGSKPDVLMVDVSDGEQEAGSWEPLKLQAMQAIAPAPVILCASDADSVGQHVAAFRRGPVFTLDKPLQAADLLLVVRHAANALR
jgi:FixJ family two-component response regulator